MTDPVETEQQEIAEEGSRIVFTNENGYYSIFVKRTYMSLGDVLENLIVPTLLAAGYNKSTISEYIPTLD